ncbi:MAG: hypothetical protein AB4040_06795, partial [Synechococcus sp.]
NHALDFSVLSGHSSGLAQQQGSHFQLDARTSQNTAIPRCTLPRILSGLLINLRNVRFGDPRMTGN